MPTGGNSPDEVARALGIAFTTQATSDGKWVRFHFVVPENHDSPEFHAAVSNITAWREKVKPWLFVGTVDVVAAKLTFGNRFRVAHYNRKNRKLLLASAKSEGWARRKAMSQPTPHQGITILDALCKCEEPETQQLRAMLVKRAAEVEAEVAALRAKADEMHAADATTTVSRHLELVKSEVA